MPVNWKLPEEQRLYRHISLEMSHTWPGEMYLRFESGAGQVVMVGVTAGDLAAICGLAAADPSRAASPPLGRWRPPAP